MPKSVHDVLNPYTYYLSKNVYSLHSYTTLSDQSVSGFRFPALTSGYRLLHLSSAEIDPFWSSRIAPKTKSADRDLAFMADFLFLETVVFFFRECFATPPAFASCRGSPPSRLSIKQPLRGQAKFSHPR